MSMYMTAGIRTTMASDAGFASEIASCIERFGKDDWGELCEEDKQYNDDAKEAGGEIFAAYKTSRGRIYIITDDTKAEPTVTTVLYAYEY